MDGVPETEADWKGFLAAATVLVQRKEAVESIDQTNGTVVRHEATEEGLRNVFFAFRL
jgi:hypothetical protein